jgi:UDPglucose 6-dehydrogenase
MKLTVIGTGYVGLVTGACFAEMGNEVVCVDVDQGKIDRLKQGILPIYEPGLDKVVVSNAKAGRLIFQTSLKAAIPGSRALFIAVGTPPGEDGSADLQYVLAVAREIGQHLSDYVVVVDKSTVPVGTGDKVRAAIQSELDKRGSKASFDVVSNPEFLKEGAAVDDFMRPDRVVIGTNSESARAVMHELYSPFMRTHERIFYMGVREAEMTKYAANAMLATKISFMNEIAGLCEQLGVDVESVRTGIGSDSRIGYSFIYPGCGYGGSCFPKDVKALIHMAEQTEYEPKVLRAVEDRNNTQKHVLYQKIVQRFGRDLSGYTFAVWGLAFKPGTDDLREASSLVLLHELIASGARVVAHDPVAMTAAQKEFPAAWFSSGQLRLMDDQYDTLRDVDAMALVTEWKPFRHPDFQRMRTLMKNPVVFDGRNQYDPAQMKAIGIEYHGIGREVA